MEKKLLLIFRFSIISLIILGLSFYETSGINFVTVIFVLAYAINSQLRYHQFVGEQRNLIVALLIDHIVAFGLVLSCPKLLLPVFSLLILDSLFYLTVPSRYVLLALGVVEFVYLGFRLPREQQFTNLSTLILFILITLYAMYLKEEEARAEDLYRELRITEDNLLKTNRELELYVDSVKELTLLQERNRISREIHDSVGHSLSTVIVQLGAMEKVAKEDGLLAAKMAAELRSFAKGGLEEIRRALRELKPKEFEDYKTILVIESLTKNFSRLTGIDVVFRFSKENWLGSEAISLVIYRAVQEFLSNAARHGEATKIDIFFFFDRESIILTMQDNGKGTDKIVLGMGLSGLHERVKELGGNVVIASSPAKGFSLRISFDLPGKASIDLPEVLSFSD